jgi:hypothetical protein
MLPQQIPVKQFEKAKEPEPQKMDEQLKEPKERVTQFPGLAISNKEDLESPPPKEEGDLLEEYQREKKKKEKKDKKKDKKDKKGKKEKKEKKHKMKDLERERSRS